jgi:hypothetical protein
MWNTALSRFVLLAPVLTSLLVLPACEVECDDDRVAGEDVTPNSGPHTWGEEGSSLPEFFPASDVSEAQVASIRTDHDTASTAWGNFGPLEFWIVGTKIEAAGVLDCDFCALRRDRDPGLPPEFDEHCANRGHSFVDYALNGGAGLNTRRTEEEEYSVFLVTLSSKYPFPDETDYTVVTYHEYFHVVQSAHIDTRDQDEREHLMVENPWWSEGGAEYMAQLLYSRQAGVDSGYLKERMSRKMGTRDLLLPGERFSDIPYGPRARIGYDLGTWFVAYLIDQVGEDTYQADFYDDLNELGWEGSFLTNFGVSSQVMLDSFEEFLYGPLEDQLDIIP